MQSRRNFIVAALAAGVASLLKVGPAAAATGEFDPKDWEAQTREFGGQYTAVTPGGSDAGGYMLLSAGLPVAAVRGLAIHYSQQIVRYRHRRTGQVYYRAEGPVSANGAFSRLIPTTDDFEMPVGRVVIESAGGAAERYTLDGFRVTSPRDTLPYFVAFDFDAMNVGDGLVTPASGG